jgi:asparagine synthetase A
MAQETEETQGYYSDNSNFNNYNVLKIRLDTEPILRNIELYLKGERLIETINESGQYQIQVIKETNPKANIKGVNSLMSWVRTTLNTQSVQGNIETFVDLGNLLHDLRIDITIDLMVNIYDWEVSDDEAEGIIDMIMNSFKLFLSRLVKNKERESYAQTIQHTERSDYTKPKSKLPFV